MYSVHLSVITGNYGRVQQDGWFQTTVTNVDPMAKQCRVLHPYVHLPVPDTLYLC